MSFRRSRYGSQRLDVSTSNITFRPYGQRAGARVEAVQIVEILRKNAIWLTGGRDRNGGPILLMPAESRHFELSEDNLSLCLSYLAGIPSHESAQNGFSVIIDNRRGLYDSAVKPIAANIQRTLNGAVSAVYCVLSDVRGSQINMNKTFGFEMQYISGSQLSMFCDSTQLTRDFGGSLLYSNDTWINNRIMVEHCMNNTASLSRDLERAYLVVIDRLSHAHPTPQLMNQCQAECQPLINSTIEAINQSRDLHGTLKSQGQLAVRHPSEPPYTLDEVTSMNRVKNCVELLEQKLDDLEGLLKGQGRREERQKRVQQDKNENRGQRTELEQAIKTVVDWILGPAEKLLLSQTGIGNSTEAAEQLRKQHEQLELKCTDSYGTYAELRHKVSELEAEVSHSSTGLDPADIRAQKEYMDTVCRSFAKRLEGRRNLVITSVRFHRLLDEANRLLNELLDLLSIEPSAADVVSAERALKTFEDKLDRLNQTCDAAFSEGVSLLDQLSVPVKNALGKDVTPDRREATGHVDRVVDDLQENKQRCDEMAELYRLKLKQILQLKTCERDVDKAICWILDLCDLTDRAKLAAKSSDLNGENRDIETTAQNSYDYGRQLLQAALLLRRSLNYDVQPNLDQSQRLAHAWQMFTKGSSELSANTNTAFDFAYQVDSLLKQVDDLTLVLNKASDQQMSVDQVVLNHSSTKDNLLSQQRRLRDVGLGLIANQNYYNGNTGRNDGKVGDIVEMKLRQMNEAMSALLARWNSVTKGLQLTGDGRLIGPDGKLWVSKAAGSRPISSHVTDNVYERPDAVGGAAVKTSAVSPYNPQWSQFVQESHQVNPFNLKLEKIHSAIALVKRIENELLPGPETTSVTSGAELYQQKLYDFNSLSTKVEVDIDRQLKTAESLSVPRDKIKEKQEIVEDLLAARSYLLTHVPKHKESLNRAVVYYESLASVMMELDDTSQKLVAVRDARKILTHPSSQESASARQQMDYSVRLLGDKVNNLQNMSKSLTPHNRADATRIQSELDLVNRKYKALEQSVMELMHSRDGGRSEKLEPAGQTSAAPSFSERLLSRTLVREGEPVRLFVRIGGHPPPVVTWFHDDRPIENGPDFEILQHDETFTLHIPEVFREDGGAITVRAENSSGRAQCTTQLVITGSAPGQGERYRSGRGIGSTDQVSTQGSGAPKQFNKPLKDQMAVEGEKLTLDCALPLWPDPDEVHWFRNGVEICPSTDYNISFNRGVCSLTIAEVFAEDSGTYVCTAFYNGIPLSTSMNLHVNGSDVIRAPVFDRQMSNISQAPGSTAHFECHVIATPIPEIVWSRTGRPMLDQARYSSAYDQVTGVTSLTIRDVTEEDEGEYTCEALNSEGESSTSAFLRVSTGPAKPFSSQTYSNAPEISVPRSGPFEGFEVSSFESKLRQDKSFMSPSDPNFGRVGSAYRGPTAVPQFVQKLENCKFTPGSDANFRCSITGNPQPNMQWYHNGRLIRPSSRYRMTLTADGECTLRVVAPTLDDSGYYTCCATNLTGRDACSAELYVEGQKMIDETSYVAPESLRWMNSKSVIMKPKDYGQSGVSEIHMAPAFQMIPADLEVNEGQMARLDCLPMGRPTPDMLWFREGVRVHEDGLHKIVLNEEGVHSLIFRTTSQHDGGRYRCVARNRAGEDEFSVNIKILPRGTPSEPKIVEPLMDIKLVEGAPLSMSISFTGTPLPAVSWYKDGRVIAVNNERYHVHTEDGVSTLYAGSALPEDSGIFHCTAVNAKGTVKSQAKLVVQGIHMPEEQVIQPPRNLPPVPSKSYREPSASSSADVKPSAELLQSVVLKRTKTNNESDYELPSKVEKTTSRVQMEPPRITSHMNPLSKISEGAKAHFECEISPAEDESIKVEWFKDGLPIAEGHRYKQSYDYGFASLDILSVTPRDEGLYVCKVISKSGTTTTQGRLLCNEDIGHRTSILPTYERERHLSDTHSSRESLSMSAMAPLFTVKLESVRVEDGESAKFLARVSGHPQPTISWWINGAPVSNSLKYVSKFDGLMHTLEIPRAVEDCAIKVKAVNSSGEAESCATLTVTRKEDFRTQLKQSSLAPVDGELSKENKPIDCKTGAMRDSGYKAESSGMTFKPSIIKPLKDVKAKEGEPVRMDVEYGGIPEPEVIWSQNGLRIESSHDFQITNKSGISTLYIPELFADDCGEYTVQIVNASGSVECSSELKLLEEKPVVKSYLPEFTQVMKDTTMTIGSPVVFECQITGQPPPSVHWKKNGLRIVPSDHYRVSNENGYCTLSIDHVRMEDAGIYECQAVSAGDKTTSCKAQLSIKASREDSFGMSQKSGESLRFIKPLTEVKSRAGSKAVLEVTLKGQPTSDVQWFLDGRQIKPGPEYQMTRDGERYMLIITHVSSHTSGVYSCKASNQNGVAETSAELLLVDEYVDKDLANKGAAIVSPKFTESLTDVTVTDGDEINLVCRVAGKPVPQIFWFHNGENINRNKDYVVLYDKETGLIKLCIKDCMPEDSGVFKCVASNMAGNTETVCTSSVTSDSVKEIKKSFGAAYRNFLDNKRNNYLFNTKQSEKYSPKLAKKKIPSAQSPKFTQFLQPLVAREGERIMMEAVVSGVPRPEVVWLKGKEMLPAVGDRHAVMFDHVTGRCNLMIRNASEIDTGVYSCQAVNSEGKTLSTANVVIVPKDAEVSITDKTKTVKKDKIINSGTKECHILESSPIFKQSLKPSTGVRFGKSFTFEATVEAKPLPVISWLLNGAVLHMSENVNFSQKKNKVKLLIKKFTQDYYGEYSCKATNIHGEAITNATVADPSKVKHTMEESRPADIKMLTSPVNSETPKSAVNPKTTKSVEEPPRFTRPLSNYTGCDGKPIVFRVNYVGTSPITVTWYFNGVKVEPVGDFRVSENLKNKESPEENDVFESSLAITEIFPDDEGEYTCAIENNQGAAVTHCYFSVSYGEETFSECGSEAAINNIKDLNEPRRYSETIAIDNRTNMRDISRQFLLPETNKVEKSEISLRSYSLPQKKKPEAQTNNPAVVTSQLQIALKQQVPQKQDVVPLAQQRSYSETYTFIKTSQVEKPVQNIKTAATNIKLESGRSNIAARLVSQAKIDIKRNLKTSEVVPERSNKTLSKSKSEQISSLDIKAPVFKGVFASQRVMDGDQVIFSTFVQGSPAPEIIWYHNDKPIGDNPDFKLKYDRQTGYVELKIVEVFPQDTGVYRCVAKNSHGESVNSSELVVEEFEYVADAEEAGFTSQAESVASLDDMNFELKTQKFLESIKKTKAELDDISSDLVQKSKSGSLNPTTSFTYYQELSNMISNFQKPNKKFDAYVHTDPTDENSYEETVLMADVKWKKAKQVSSTTDSVNVESVGYANELESGLETALVTKVDKDIAVASGSRCLSRVRELADYTSNQDVYNTLCSSVSLDSINIEPRIVRVESKDVAQVNIVKVITKEDSKEIGTPRSRKDRNSLPLVSAIVEELSIPEVKANIIDTLPLVQVESLLSAPEVIVLWPVIDDTCENLALYQIFNKDNAPSKLAHINMLEGISDTEQRISIGDNEQSFSNILQDYMENMEADVISLEGYSNADNSEVSSLSQEPVTSPSILTFDDSTPRFSDLSETDISDIVEINLDDDIIMNNKQPLSSGIFSDEDMMWLDKQLVDLSGTDVNNQESFHVDNQTKSLKYREIDSLEDVFSTNQALIELRNSTVTEFSDTNLSTTRYKSYIRPEFDNPLFDMTAFKGSKTVLVCHVIGFPKPSISWFVDGEEIRASPDFIVGNDEDGTCTLTILNTLIEDEGEYTARAVNELGECRTSTYLSVCYKEDSSENGKDSQSVEINERDDALIDRGSKSKLDDLGSREKTLTTSVTEAVTVKESNSKPQVTKVTKTVEYTTQETLVMPSMKSSTFRETLGNEPNLAEIRSRSPSELSETTASDSYNIYSTFESKVAGPSSENYESYHTNVPVTTSSYEAYETGNIKSQTMKHSAEITVDKNEASRKEAENRSLEVEEEYPSVLNLALDTIPSAALHGNGHETSYSFRTGANGNGNDIMIRPHTISYDDKSSMTLQNEFLQQEIEKSAKIHEVETTDEITVETKITEINTVLMHLSSSGDMSVTETTEVKTDTDLRETKKILEREEIIASHKTLDGQELDQASWMTPEDDKEDLTGFHQSYNVSTSKYGTGFEESDTQPASTDSQNYQVNQDYDPYNRFVPQDDDFSYMARTSFIGGDGDSGLYIAASNYEPENDDVMSLHEGEKLEIVDDREEDWWLVKKVFDNRQGRVPAQYLRDKRELDRRSDEDVRRVMEKVSEDSNETLSGKPKVPAIVRHLSDMSSFDGEPVRFECLISGNPKPQIVWFHDGKLVKATPDFLQFYDTDGRCSLSIKEVFPEDTGRYTVAAKNIHGTVQTSAELTVRENEALKESESVTVQDAGEAPVIITRPKAQVVDEGQTVTFFCKLTSPSPPKIVWKRNGQKAEESSDCRIETQGEGSTHTSSLTLTQATVQDAGKYEIEVTNEFGQTDLSVSLVVKEKPKTIDFKAGLKKAEPHTDRKNSKADTDETGLHFEEKPLDRTVREGESVIFTCRLTPCMLPISMSWFFQGKPIVNGDVYRIQQDSEGGSSLEIADVYLEDAGVYTVRATNSLSTAESTVILTVTELTETAAEGDTVRLEDDNAESSLISKTTNMASSTKSSTDSPSEGSPKPDQKRSTESIDNCNIGVSCSHETNTIPESVLEQTNKPEQTLNLSAESCNPVDESLKPVGILTSGLPEDKLEKDVGKMLNTSISQLAAIVDNESADKFSAEIEETAEISGLNDSLLIEGLWCVGVTHACAVTSFYTQTSSSSILPVFNKSPVCVC